MRIVHTSDWHAGRVWKNINRLDELETVFENLGSFVEREKIDLLLMSGDVFDSGAPSAEAERCVFRFLKRIGMLGTHTVLVAGNHDNPARIDAWGTLAELVSVRALGRPRSARNGGVIEVATRSGERAIVAAIPFAAPRYLVSALELAEGETLAKQRYSDALRDIVEDLSRSFRSDAVNLLVSHTHIDGAAYSGSERTVHLGDDWAGTPQALPASAHYVALGHIHRPQKISASPAPAYYAGSPLQLDFGEQDDTKTFNFIEAMAGKPARIESIPYEGAKTLETVRKTLEELEVDASALQSRGWLQVIVPVEAPVADLATRVRKLVPNAVRVAVELPKRAEPTAKDRPPQGAPPHELYRAYFRKQHQSEPEESLIEAFNALYDETSGGEA